MKVSRNILGAGCLYNSDCREGGLFLLQEYIDFICIFGYRWVSVKYKTLHEEGRKGK
jgi:hypothetical protein